MVTQQKEAVLIHMDAIYSNLCELILLQLERDIDRPVLSDNHAQKLLMSCSEIIHRSQHFQGSAQMLKSVHAAMRVSALLLLEDYDISLLDDVTFSQRFLDDQCSFFAKLTSHDELEISLQSLIILTQSLPITKRKRRFEVIEGVSLMDSLIHTPNLLEKLREVLTTITSNDFRDSVVLGWTFFLSALSNVDVLSSKGSELTFFP